MMNRISRHLREREGEGSSSTGCQLLWSLRFSSSTLFGSFSFFNFFSLFPFIFLFLFLDFLISVLRNIQDVRGARCRPHDTRAPYQVQTVVRVLDGRQWALPAPFIFLRTNILKTSLSNNHSIYQFKLLNRMFGCMNFNILILLRFSKWWNGKLLIGIVDNCS